jgi:hypothetical protein
MAMFGNTITRASGSTMPSSEWLTFDVTSAGELVQKSGDLELMSTTVPQTTPALDFAHITVTISRGESVERVSLTRNHGKWMPIGEGRTLVDYEADDPYTFLPGPMSDPFPSGDVVIARYPQH